MTHSTQHFPLDRWPDITQNTDDFRLLERIPLSKQDIKWPVNLSPTADDEFNLVLLDTETTGLSAEHDAIIELGMVKVSYSPSKKRITSILDVISLYEDPGKPIPDNITELTGITDDMVKNQKIDDSIVAEFLSDDALVVAHNAQFDRPFFENRFPSLNHLSWACSAFGINWSALGFESAKLEYLLLRLGWFYEGHRASVDCLAVAWLFHQHPEALENLLSEAMHRTVLVRAFGAPFDVKDFLKARGYRWHAGNNGANKHWWREVSEDLLEDEQSYLNQLYHRGADYAHYDYKDARNRFK